MVAVSRESSFRQRTGGGARRAAIAASRRVNGVVRREPLKIQKADVEAARAGS